MRFYVLSRSSLGRGYKRSTPFFSRFVAFFVYTIFDTLGHFWHWYFFLHNYSFYLSQLHSKRLCRNITGLFGSIFPFMPSSSRMDIISSRNGCFSILADHFHKSVKRVVLGEPKFYVFFGEICNFNLYFCKIDYAICGKLTKFAK
jgi:hypothetical protein